MCFSSCWDFDGEPLEVDVRFVLGSSGGSGGFLFTLGFCGAQSLLPLGFVSVGFVLGLTMGLLMGSMLGFCWDQWWGSSFGGSGGDFLGLFLGFFFFRIFLGFFFF